MSMTQKISKRHHMVCCNCDKTYCMPDMQGQITAMLAHNKCPDKLIPLYPTECDGDCSK